MDLGNDVSPIGSPTSIKNMVIVKYNADGTALWARTVTGPAHDSVLNDIAVGSDGIYVAGYLWGCGTWDFGNSKYVTTTNGGYNPIIIKYDANGLPQWVATTVSGNSTNLYSISVYDEGIYVAGFMAGKFKVDFGNNATATGYYSGLNPLLVKYNLSGIAQWARTSVYNYSDLLFFSVSNDNSSVCVSGGFMGITGVSFGENITALGQSENNNGILVKYSKNGDPIFCRSAVQGNFTNFFNSVEINDGAIYLSGTCNGYGSLELGNGVAINTLGSQNPIVIKYNINGVAQWAKSTTTPIPGTAISFGTVIDGNDIYVAGYMLNGACDFGNDVRATGMASGNNFLLVKYYK